MRKYSKRSEDKARVMRDKHDQTPKNLWEAMRDRYPEETQAMVDAAADGMTLKDLIQLELAEHERLSAILADAHERIIQGGELGHKTLASICSVQLQSRKNLRVLVMASGPALSMNTMPVVVPEGLSVQELRDFDFEADDILS
jgi:hypothetical protein